MKKNTLILQYFQKNDELQISQSAYKKVVLELFQWLLAADDAAHDLTGSLFPEENVTGKIISKQDTVVSGLEEAAFLLKNETGVDFFPEVNDGDEVKKGKVIAAVSGSSCKILSLERTILNILQRMSGIATETKKYVTKINSKTTFIAATRKTPWMLLDKKAVTAGGGLTHRLSLSDGILIKDNHLEVIKSKLGITTEQEAIKKVLELILPQIQNSLIEIETNTPEGARAAIDTFCYVVPTMSGPASYKSGNEILKRVQDDDNFRMGTRGIVNTNCLAVMLDNWKPEEAEDFIKSYNIEQKKYPIIFEASGNIIKKNLAHWAKTGVNVISVGSLTHSVKAADLSMELIPE